MKSINIQFLPFLLTVATLAIAVTYWINSNYIEPATQKEITAAVEKTPCLSDELRRHLQDNGTITKSDLADLSNICIDKEQTAQIVAEQMKAIPSATGLREK